MVGILESNAKLNSKLILKLKLDLSLAISALVPPSNETKYFIAALIYFALRIEKIKTIRCNGTNPASNSFMLLEVNEPFSFYTIGIQPHHSVLKVSS